jgi:hypothetical protein
MEIAYPTSLCVVLMIARAVNGTGARLFHVTLTQEKRAAKRGTSGVDELSISSRIGSRGALFDQLASMISLHWDSFSAMPPNHCALCSIRSEPTKRIREEKSAQTVSGLNFPD